VITVSNNFITDYTLLLVCNCGHFKK